MARAYAINLIVLPTSANRDLLVVVGSDDRALDLLTQRLRDDQHGPDVVSLATGSLAGLIALRQGVGDVAGSHLPENGRGQFNRSYVRAIFPDRSLLLITLAYRVQGLVIQAGNPLGLRGVGDLVRLRAPIVNRNRGSGTRAWFDRLLSEAGAKSGDLPGYENEVATHAEVAAAVASGSAQAGLATAAAGTARGLAFVPLFKERYELVVPTEKVNRAPVTRLLATLDSRFARRDRKAAGLQRSVHGTRSADRRLTSEKQSPLICSAVNCKLQWLQVMSRGCLCGAASQASQRAQQWPHVSGGPVGLLCGQGAEDRHARAERDGRSSEHGLGSAVRWGQGPAVSLYVGVCAPRGGPLGAGEPTVPDDRSLRRHERLTTSRWRSVPRVPPLAF